MLNEYLSEDDYTSRILSLEGNENVSEWRVRGHYQNNIKQKMDKLDSSSLLDVPVSFVKGVAGGAGGMYGMADALTGGNLDEATGRNISGAFTSVDEWLQEQKSPHLQRLEQEFAEKEGFINSAKHIKDNPWLALGMGTESLGYMANIVGATRVGIVQVSKVAYKAALKRGATEAVAKRAARMAAGKASEKIAIAANTGVVGGGSFADGRDSVVNMTDAELKSADGYKELKNEGLSDAEIRDELAFAVGSTQGLIAGITSTVASKVFKAGKFEGDILSGRMKGKTGSVIVKGLEGASKEAGQEWMESGGEAAGANRSIQSYIDSSRGIWEGVPKASGIGALLGAGLGGTMGVGSGLVSEPDVAKRERDKKRVADEIIASGGDALDVELGTAPVDVAHDQHQLQGKLLGAARRKQLEQDLLEQARLSRASNIARGNELDRQFDEALADINDKQAEQLRAEILDNIDASDSDFRRDQELASFYEALHNKAQGRTQESLNRLGDDLTAVTEADEPINTAMADAFAGLNLEQEQSVAGEEYAPQKETVEFTNTEIPAPTAEEQRAVLEEKGLMPKRTVVKPVNPKTDTLRQAITKLGGIKRSEIAADEVVDTAEFAGNRMFRADGGLSLEAMAEKLAEHGYVSLDEHGKYDTEQLKALIKKQLAKDEPDVMAQEGYEQDAAQQAQDYYGREFEPVEPLTNEEMASMDSSPTAEEIAEYQNKMLAEQGDLPEMLKEQAGYAPDDTPTSGAVTEPQQGLMPEGQEGAVKPKKATRLQQEALDEITYHAERVDEDTDQQYGEKIGLELALEANEDNKSVRMALRRVAVERGEVFREISDEEIASTTHSDPKDKGYDFQYKGKKWAYMSGEDQAIATKKKAVVKPKETKPEQKAEETVPEDKEVKAVPEEKQAEDPSRNPDDYEERNRASLTIDSLEEAELFLKRNKNIKGDPILPDKKEKLKQSIIEIKQQLLAMEKAETAAKQETKPKTVIKAKPKQAKATDDSTPLSDIMFTTDQDGRQSAEFYLNRIDKRLDALYTMKRVC